MIDIHAHYLSPSALREAGQYSRPSRVAYDSDQQTLVFPSGPSRPIPTTLTDLEKRMEWNGEQGIVQQVLSPWLDITGDDLPLKDALDWCRVLNESTAADISAYRSSLSAFAAIPLLNPEIAAGELERVVRDWGFAGGVVPTQVGGENLDALALQPLFEVAQSLGATLFIHPFRVMEERRLREDYMWNICGNPFETTVAALTLAFRRVFEKYPDLKILLAHCGGTLPFIGGRAAQAVRGVSSVHAPFTSSTEILSYFYYDTVLHDPMALAFAIQRLGASRLALGTDAPFPMAVDNPLKHLTAALELAEGTTAHLDEITRLTPIHLLEGTEPT